jgi:opacity protein-like surface antigen
MKKLLLACFMLSSTLSASGLMFGIGTYDIAKLDTSGLIAGAPSLAKMENHGNQFMFGMVAENEPNKSLYLGYDFITSYANLGYADMFGIDTDLKIGLRLTNFFSTYAIGGIGAQFLDTSAKQSELGWGFVYGIGTEYKLSKQLALTFEWKVKPMTITTNYGSYDYDYNTADISLKYFF